MQSLKTPFSTRLDRSARPCLRTCSVPAAASQCRPQRLVAARATDEADAALEQRLENLRKASKKETIVAPVTTSKLSSQYDFTDEQVHWEGAPDRRDLWLNLALGTTLFWLPLTAAAVARQAFVNYRFTTKRLSVQTTAPWRTEQTDIAYQEIKEVVTVSRAFGVWGDMVVTLLNNDKVELRSLPNFLELKKYVLARRDELGVATPAPAAAPRTRPKGKDITAAELMGEEPEKKGF